MPREEASDGNSTLSDDDLLALSGSLQPLAQVRSEVAYRTGADVFGCGSAGVMDQAAFGMIPSA